jgi:hypothetical protein
MPIFRRNGGDVGTYPTFPNDLLLFLCQLPRRILRRIGTDGSRGDTEAETRIQPYLIPKISSSTDDTCRSCRRRKQAHPFSVTSRLDFTVGHMGCWGGHTHQHTLHNTNEMRADCDCGFHRRKSIFQIVYGSRELFRVYLCPRPRPYLVPFTTVNPPIHPSTSPPWLL